MKKINVLWIALDTLLLVLFNVLFYSIGGAEHDTIVWASYAFIHASYIIQYTYPFFHNEKKGMKIKKATIIEISNVYFFLALLTGTVFIIWSGIDSKIVILTQVIQLCLYLFFFIINLIVIENGNRKEREMICNSEAYVRCHTEHHQSYDNSNNSAGNNISLLENDIRQAMKKIDDEEARKIMDSLLKSAENCNLAKEEKFHAIDEEIFESLQGINHCITTKDYTDLPMYVATMLDLIQMRNQRDSPFEEE